MIRELIKPVDNTYVLNLPDEMIGKTVEVIAFEVDAAEEPVLKKTGNIEDIKKKYSRYPVVSHDDFTFNRNEANDYE